LRMIDDGVEQGNRRDTSSSWRFESGRSDRPARPASRAPRSLAPASSSRPGRAAGRGIRVRGQPGGAARQRAPPEDQRVASSPAYRRAVEQARAGDHATADADGAAVEIDHVAHAADGTELLSARTPSVSRGGRDDRGPLRRRSMAARVVDPAEMRREGTMHGREVRHQAGTARPTRRVVPARSEG